jgi:hypothetical protein
MRAQKKGSGRRKPARRTSRGAPAAAGTASHVADVVGELNTYHETGPRLTGGDLDADWRNAGANGDEAVGGSTATPDQDVVDELGTALGVPQAPDAEVVTSAEILADRDRHRWTLEREITHETRVAEGDEDEGA